MRKKSTADQVLDNQVSGKKDVEPWYYAPVMLPLFNGEEINARQENARHGKDQRKPMAYSIFAELFLAPMVLPHKRGDASAPIWERQRAFLEQYRQSMEGKPEKEGEKKEEVSLYSDTPGLRAQDLLYFFDDDERVSALSDNRKTGYSKKTDTYANPERYLSFYRAAKQEDISLAETVYTQQLKLIFLGNESSLANRLRYLLSTMPENGAFLLENRPLEDEVVLSLAGKILQTALLLAAADRLQGGEVYQLLKKKLGIPMPVNVAIAGRRARQRVTLPLYAVEQLCSTLCAEGLSQAAAQALLPLVQTMPAAQRAESLETMIQEMERQMRELDGQVCSEKDRERKRLLRAQAQELDNLIGELYEQKQQAEEDLADSSSGQ